jgi:hypothetical protein
MRTAEKKSQLKSARNDIYSPAFSIHDTISRTINRDKQLLSTEKANDSVFNEFAVPKQMDLSV